MEWAAKVGYVEVVQFLLENELQLAVIESAFRLCISHNKASVMRLFILDGRARVLMKGVYENARDDNKDYCALSTAAGLGEEQLVHMLLNDERVEPNSLNDLPIRIAANRGHIEIVRLLLEDGRVNPLRVENNDSAVSLAIKCHHNDIVMLFLEKLPIKPIEIYGLAIKEKNNALVKMMLNAKLVTPQVCRSMGFRLAAAEGDTDTVKNLLNNPEIQPDIMAQEAFRMACANNHLEVVNLLLTDPRIHPQAMQNHAFRHAAANGDLQVVKRLLQEERVNPCDMENKAIKQAILNGHYEVCSLLLKDKRMHLLRLLDLLGRYEFDEKNNTLFLNKFNEFVLTFFVTDSIFSHDQPLLAHLVLFVFEKNRAMFKESPLIHKHALYSNAYQAISFLAEKGYSMQALSGWLAVPSSDERYHDARFQAFQCAYNQYKSQELKTLDAFFEALPCCLDSNGNLLDFSAENQLIFDCYLFAACGIDLYPNALQELNFMPSQRHGLILYVILLITQHELSSYNPSSLSLIINPNPSSFFTQSSKKELIVKLTQCLPSSLKSLADLTQLKDVFEDTTLMQQIKYELNHMTSVRKNLKTLLNLRDFWIEEFTHSGGSIATPTVTG
jgi:ankyrin repeat protein